MDSSQFVRDRVKRKRVTLLLVAALLSAGFMIFADYHAVSPRGSWGILVLRDFTAILLLVGVFVFFKGLIQLLRRHSRRTGLVNLLVGFLIVALILEAARMGNRVRMNAFAALAERSAPLVDAIRKYEQVHGQPPSALADLIPEFLAVVPQTEMGAYPQYKYRRGSESDDGNPWVLSVFTPTGVPDFDEFFFYPLQNYPLHRWGTNPVERIRDWAYLHE